MTVVLKELSSPSVSLLINESMNKVLFIHIYFRPKKSPQSGPVLPTRQSLRLRNKDPQGLALPDTPENTSEPVDEHVSMMKIEK